MNWREWLARYSSAGTLAVGSALAQVILFLSTPFITRLYGPDEYGIFGLFSMTVAVLTPFCGMCLSSALALAVDERERVSLAQTGIALSVLSSGALTIVLGLLALLTDGFFEMATESWLIWWGLAATATVLSIVGQFAYQWDLLQQNFERAAIRTLAATIVSTSARIALGFVWPTGRMLAVGQALGLAVAAGTLRRFNPLRVGWCVDWSLMKRYSDFPLHQSWQQIVNVLSRMMPIPLFTTAFGAASAGQYAIAMLTLGVAGQVIGKAVGDAALPEFARSHRLGEALLPVLRRSTRQLVALGVLPFLLVVVVGPQLFGLVFGSEWREAGEFARWMAPWLFVAFLNAPSLTLIKMLRLQAWASRLNFMTLIVRGAGLFFGVYMLQSAVWGVMLFSMAGLLHNVLLIREAFRRARHHASLGAV
jgi:O-antigen/teichoic acid export membrane protein